MIYATAALFGIFAIHATLVVALMLLMRRGARIPFPPEAKPLAPDETDVPELMIRALGQVRPALAELEFRPVPGVALVYGRSSTTYILPFRGDGTTFAIFSYEDSRGACTVLFQSLTARYGDVISTARDAFPLDIVEPHEELRLVFPPMALEELLRLHEAAARAIGGDGVLDAPEDLAAHVVSVHDFRFARAFERRVMFLDSGATRYTWPWLFRNAIWSLPPLRFLARAIAARRARRLAEGAPRGELGVLRSKLRAAERGRNARLA